ncbi:MAG: acylphosphatase [Chitinophagaceae bacterium]
MKTIAIVIRGKVQGVFYRKTAKDKARELGLTGWVRNEDDGSVRIEVSGEEKNLEQLVKWCAEGPPRAVVTEVQVTDLPYHNFAQFISER